MTNADKKRKAKTLFIATDMHRKDIAKEVSVTEKTLRKWIDENNWEQVKEAKTITRQQLLQETYEQLAAVNKEIREQHNNVPNKQLSDAKGVLRKEIEALENLPMHNIIEVCMEITSYLNEFRPTELFTVTELLNEFVKYKESQK